MTSAAYASLLLVLLALAAFLLFRLARKSSSKEFSGFAEQWNGTDWGRKLLGTGPRRRWTLEAAWQAAHLDERETVAAIAALGKSSTFKEYRPLLGELLEQSMMATPDNPRREFVLSTTRPGLLCNTDGAPKVLEKAVVQSASSDYLALGHLADNATTKLYWGQLRPSDFRLENLRPDLLDEVACTIPSDSELDAWLKELIVHAPAKDLAAVVDNVHVPFSEQAMLRVNELRTYKHSVVKRVLHRGLRRTGRAREELLLRARVEIETTNPNSTGGHSR
jgi:hypothetical protein